jgi:hypothetical protein
MSSGSTMNERRGARPLWHDDLLLLALTAALCALYVGTAGGNFPLDDSWIHQTYARNLATLGEWSFVPGVPSAASTSPLYTLLLAAGYTLGIPFRLWAHGMGGLALALTGMIGMRLALRLLPGSRWTARLTGIAIVGAWHLLWGAVAGMETAIFGLFTLLLMLLAWRELDAPPGWSALIGRAMLFGAAAGVITLARAEGVVLVGLLGVGVLAARPGGRGWGGLVYGAAAGVVFALILAPYLLFNLEMTGGLLPDTAAAKRAAAAPLFLLSLPERIGMMLEPIAAGGQLLLVPGMIAFGVRLLRERRPLLLFAPLVWSVGLVIVYAALLPLNIQHGRYLIPALPAAIVCGVNGTAWLLALGRSSMPGRVLTRALALTTAAVFVLFALTLGLRAYEQDVRIIDEEMVAAAFWLRDNLPPEELLAVHDIGAVGYFAPRPILDIAGLVTPEFIPLVGDPAAMWALIEQRGARYLMALDNQIPGGNVADPRLCRVFTTGQERAIRAGGTNMSIYALNFGAGCPQTIP